MKDMEEATPEASWTAVISHRSGERGERRVRES